MTGREAGTARGADRREARRTGVAANERNPRWDEGFDFCAVSAASVLEATLMARTGLAGGLAGGGLKLKDRFADRAVGRVTLPVEGVAREGRVRGAWPLMAAASGELELRLRWAPLPPAASRAAAAVTAAAAAAAAAGPSKGR